MTSQAIQTREPVYPSYPTEKKENSRADPEGWLRCAAPPPSPPRDRPRSDPNPPPPSRMPSLVFEPFASPPELCAWRWGVWSLCCLFTARSPLLVLSPPSPRIRPSGAGFLWWQVLTILDFDGCGAFE